MHTFNGLSLFMLMIAFFTIQYLMKKLIKNRRIKRIYYEHRRRNSLSSADGMNQIFIAPHLPTPIEVIDTLVHELVHAVDDCQSGHGENFKRIAKDIGLKGPMRSAGAGEELMKDLIKIADLLGNFPHGRLNIPRAASSAGVKRPGAKCLTCGYEIVMLKKFLEVGAPFCPMNHGLMEGTGDWY